MRKVRGYFFLLSLLATLTAGQHSQAQSTFFFVNFVPGFVDAPVFDAFGNPLSGTNYLAMLYGGDSVDSLQPATIPNSSQVITPVPFTYLKLPSSTGYFNYTGLHTPYSYVQV